MTKFCISVLDGRIMEDLDTGNLFISKNNKPTTYTDRVTTYKKWPATIPEEINEELLPYFEALKKERPEIAETISTCVELLIPE